MPQRSASCFTASCACFFVPTKSTLLPACTAYDYNFAQGQTGFEPMISVAVNGKTLGEDRKYAVTEKAGSRLEVVYAAGSAKETFYIDVIAPKYLSE